jgi:Tfp pilus assembly protein PilN
MTTININLLPEELRARPSGGGFGGGGDGPSKEAIMPIVLGGLLAVAIGAVPFMMNSMWLDPKAAKIAEDEAAIQQEIDKYNTTLNSLKSIADKKEVLRAQLATLQSVAGGSMSWGDVLNEMRSLTPGNLWFDSFKCDTTTGKISVSGAALDYSSVAYFHRNLQTSEYFLDPVLSKTDMATGGNGISLVNFQIDVIVRKNAKKS